MTHVWFAMGDSKSIHVLRALASLSLGDQHMEKAAGDHEDYLLFRREEPPLTKMIKTRTSRNSKTCCFAVMMTARALFAYLAVCFHSVCSTRNNSIIADYLVDRAESQPLKKSLRSAAPAAQNGVMCYSFYESQLFKFFFCTLPV